MIQIICLSKESFPAKDNHEDPTIQNLKRNCSSKIVKAFADKFTPGNTNDGLRDHDPPLEKMTHYILSPDIFQGQSFAREYIWKIDVSILLIE